MHRPADSRVAATLVLTTVLAGFTAMLAGTTRPLADVRRQSHAQPPAPWHLEHVAHLGGATNAVAVAGDVVFAGLGTRVVALDARDPAAPVLLDQGPMLGGVVQDLVLEGGLLYASWMAGVPEAGRGGLAVLDVADPARMALLRDTPVDVAARRLAVADGVALLAGSYDRQWFANEPRGAVLPVDPRTAGAPLLGERHVLQHAAVAIARSGPMAYVLESRNGFDEIAVVRAMDASDPLRPRPVAVLSVPGPARALAAAGSRLYVAGGAGGLRVVGIGPDGGLRDLGRASTSGACADDVALSPDGLLVLDACADRLLGFGVADDGWPVAQGALAVPPSATRAAWLGAHAAVALGGRGGALLVDARRPDGLEARGAWAPDAPLGAPSALVLHSDGQSLTVAGPSTGLTTLRLDGAGQPPRVAAHLDVDGLQDLDAIGRHVVATDVAAARLYVFDVGDIAAPRLVGSLSLPNAVDAVAHPVGPVVYVPGDGYGLRAVSVLDPARPTVAATDSAIRARTVVRGAGGLLALDSLHLLALDIADPLAPAVVGRIGWFGIAFSLDRRAAASDHWAYIASADGSGCDRRMVCSALSVVDVSDASAPRLVTSHRLDGEPEPSALALDGERLVLGGGLGLTVLDSAALESSFAPLATYAAPGQVMDVTVAPGAGDERLLVVAEADAGLGVYRLARSAAPTATRTAAAPWPTPPAAPSASATRADPSRARLFLPYAARQALGSRAPAALELTYAALGPTYGVAVGAGVVYHGHGGSVAAIALEGEPIEVGRTPGLAGLVHDLAVDGELLFAAAGNAGLAAFSLADPRRPTLVGMAATGDTARGVAVAGGLAYVAAGDAGLEVFDVADPARPRRIGSAPVAGRARRVWLERGHAFVANLDDGPIAVYDLSSPAQPRRVAQLGEDHVGGWALAVHGDHAYVASCANCLAIIDIADPSAPALDDAVLLIDEVFASDLAISQGHLLALTGETVEAYDLADPLAPAHAGSAALDGYARRMAVHGAVAAAVTDYGLESAEWFDPHGDPGPIQLLDAADPRQMRSLGSVWPAFVGTGLVLPAADPAALYVVGLDLAALPPEDQAQAHLLDLDDPDRPRRGARVPELGDVRDMVVQGTTGYAIRGGSSLAVLDLRAPENPVTLASLELDAGLSALAISGDTLLVRSSTNRVVEGGWVFTATFHVVDVGDPARPARAASIAVPGGGGTPALSEGTAWLPVPGGIRAVDVTDPWHPVEVGHLALPGLGATSAPSQVVADGGRVWVASSRGLFAVDGADPGRPRLLGSAEGAFHALRLLAPDRLLASGCGLTLFRLPSDGVPIPIAARDLLPHVPLRCSMGEWSGGLAAGRFYGVPELTVFGGLYVVDVAGP